jgi:serine/threonine protein kinase
MASPPSITVNRETTLTQLQEFTKDIKDTKRLRGKENEDGSITLYVKDTKRGLGSKLFGYSQKSVQKREMARQAVEMVFTNTERSMKDPQLRDLRLALTKTTGGELTGGGLKLLTDALEQRVYRDKGIVGGPGLNSIPEGTKQNLLDWSAGKIVEIVNGNGDQETLKQTFMSDLGTRISDNFRIMSTDKKCENLALSNGSVLKSDLRSELEPLLREQLGRDHPALTDKALLDELLDGAFEVAAQQLLPNHGKKGEWVSIGNEIYTFDRQLGEGAHATASVYVNKETGKQIVLKTALQGDEEDMQEFGRELRSHRTVSGHDNIVGLVGPVRMDDGTVGLALEFAPHGDLYGAMDRINQNTNPDEAKLMRLTLLHDVVEGLGHMQSRRGGEGMLHLDFGSRNIFVGEGGVGKIGDFGTSMKSSKFDIDTTHGAINKYMIAPEITIALGESEGQRLKMTGPRSEQYGLTLDKIKGQFGELGENRQKEILTSVLNNIAYTESPSRQIDPKKAEVWCLGVIAFEMMMGQLPVPDGSQTEAKYVEFGSNLNNRALNSYDENGNLVPGFFGETTGDPDVDDLVNKLLHPDPNQRPTPEEIVNHPAFRPEVFDSNLGHQLVQGLIDQPQPGGL